LLFLWKRPKNGFLLPNEEISGENDEIRVNIEVGFSIFHGPKTRRV
jgi:hypothetical protein